MATGPGCAKAIEFKMPSGALTERGELPKCGMRGDEAFARELLLRDPPPKIVTVRHLGLTPGRRAARPCRYRLRPQGLMHELAALHQ
jgi:hypothetical protein